MKEKEKLTDLPIEHLVRNGTNLTTRQRQALLEFHDEVESQSSWKREVFKEVLSEASRSTEGIKRREECRRQLHEMLLKNHMER